MGTAVTPREDDVRHEQSARAAAHQGRTCVRIIPRRLHRCRANADEVRCNPPLTPRARCSLCCVLQMTYSASAADGVSSTVAREPEAGVVLLAVQQRPKERFPFNRKEWCAPSAPSLLESSSLQLYLLRLHRQPHVFDGAEDVWGWERGPFLSVISGDSFSVSRGDTSQRCDPRAPLQAGAGSSPVWPPDWNFTNFGFIGEGNRIIAPIYMRQLRVPTDSCSVKLSFPKVALPFF